MARRDDSLIGIVGSIAIIIWIIIETFSGNFIPILVILGIILVIYIFIKVSNFMQPKKENEPILVNSKPKEDFNFQPYILFFLIFGGIMVSVFFNNSSNHNNKQEIVPVENPIPSDEIVDSTASAVEIPEDLKWINNDFVNARFQIPENLVLEESLSSNNSKLYIDFTSNISMSIVADLLNDEMVDKTIDDFVDNISILANNINEDSKRNFDDFKLQYYEMSNLGNSKAIKIVQSSKKVSGLKNIEMRIISYHVILKPYYYKVTFSCPQEKSEFLETFEQINKTFDFNTSSDSENVQDVNKFVNNDLGYYTVISSSIDTVYFHNNPDERFKRKGYLTGNESVFVQEIVNGFGYIDYTNDRGLKSKGWIKMSSLLKSEN